MKFAKFVPSGLLAAALSIRLAEPLKAQPAALVPLSAFDLTQVRVLEGPFRHAQDMDLRYLMALDPDRFLHSFRMNAGLPSHAEPYGGWEAPTSELRGHATGHYLSALSLMYASTGDIRLKQRIDYLVAELAKCQAALTASGSHPGYLSAFPESFFDRVDNRKGVWAPWYTMHKIMAGLIEAYQNGRDPQAAEVLRGLGAWVKFRVDRLPVEQFQASLQNEPGQGKGRVRNLGPIASVDRNETRDRRSRAGKTKPREADEPTISHGWGLQQKRGADSLGHRCRSGSQE